jgi:hypothetical protein
VYGLNAILQTIPGDRQYPESALNQGMGARRNTEELTGTGNFFALFCTDNTLGFVREVRPSRLPSDSNQWLRADTGLTGRSIDHRRRLRSRTLRRAIAGFGLIRFVTRGFPALLVNTLHLHVAEEAAFLRINPTGHTNFSARSTERCVLRIAPAPMGFVLQTGRSTCANKEIYP